MTDLELQHIIAFADSHADCDALQLVLQQAKHPGVDLALVAQQLEGRKQAAGKWPSLHATANIWYPVRLSREQSSSEATACHKTRCYIEPGWHVADLTGGMGMDSMAMAQVAATVDYCEADAMLCQGMEHNCRTLGIGNVTVHHADSLEWLSAQERHFDAIYIDPARRDGHGGKVCAFEHCTPNIMDSLPMLLHKGRRLIIKASPMIDLATASSQLGGALYETQIIALHGEAKEVLFVCQTDNTDDDPTIVCVNITKGAFPQLDSFTRQQEQQAQACIATELGEYLYEPNAALMKGGCYKLLSQWYNAAQIDPSSHLYTSNTPIEDYPGRGWRILQRLKLAPKEVAKALQEHCNTPQRAHVVCRNYPVGAAALQKQLKLSEGGDLFIVATTLRGQKIGLLCQPVG